MAICTGSPKSARRPTNVIWKRWRWSTRSAWVRVSWNGVAPVSYHWRMRRALQPLASDDQALFVAALHGEHAIRGFRNGEFAQLLYGPRPDDPGERRRQCGRVSRRISLLRARSGGQVSTLAALSGDRAGQRFMSTAIRLRTELFPKELSGD